jgi:hypothetical protein
LASEVALVAVDKVSVVALFASVDHAVATRRVTAVLAACVGITVVVVDAIVALLAGVENTITTLRRRRKIRRNVRGSNFGIRLRVGGPRVGRVGAHVAAGVETGVDSNLDAGIAGISIVVL